MKNTMKEINLNEMEKVNGGRHYFKDPGETTLEDNLIRKIEPMEGPDFTGLRTTFPQETSDMPDPQIHPEIIQRVHRISQEQ